MKGFPHTATAALCIAVLACSAAQAQLRIGLAPAMDADGCTEFAGEDPAGFDADLLRLVAEKLDEDVEIIRMPEKSVISALMTDTIDVAASGIDITDSGAENLIFTEDYLDTGYSLVIRRSDAARFRSASDLGGELICVNGRGEAPLAASQITAARVRRCESNDAAYTELRHYGCRAVFAERTANSHLMVHNQRNRRIYKHLPAQIGANRFCLAALWSKTALISRINSAIREIKASGEYEKLCLKWFGEPRI